MESSDTKRRSADRRYRRHLGAPGDEECEELESGSGCAQTTVVSDRGPAPPSGKHWDMASLSHPPEGPTPGRIEDRASGPSMVTGPVAYRMESGCSSIHQAAVSDPKCVADPTGPPWLTSPFTASQVTDFPVPPELASESDEGLSSAMSRSRGAYEKATRIWEEGLSALSPPSTIDRGEQRAPVVVDAEASPPADTAPHSWVPGQGRTPNSGWRPGTPSSDWDFSDSVEPQSTSSDSLATDGPFTPLPSDGAASPTAQPGGLVDEAAASPVDTGSATILNNPECVTSSQGPEGAAILNVPELPTILDSPEQAAILGSSEGAAILDSPKPVAILGSSEQAAILDSPKPVAILGSSERAAILDSPEQAAILGSSEGAAILNSPEQAAILGSSERAAILDSPKQAAILGSSERAAILDSPKQAAILGSSEGAAILDSPEQAAVLLSPEQAATLHAPEPAAILDRGECATGPEVATIPDRDPSGSSVDALLLAAAAALEHSLPLEDDTLYAVASLPATSEAAKASSLALRGPPVPGPEAPGGVSGEEPLLGTTESPGAPAPLSSEDAAGSEGPTATALLADLLDVTMASLGLRPGDPVAAVTECPLEECDNPFSVAARLLARMLGSMVTGTNADPEPAGFPGDGPSAAHPASSSGDMGTILDTEEAAPFGGFASLAGPNPAQPDNPTRGGCAIVGIEEAPPSGDRARPSSDDPTAPAGAGTCRDSVDAERTPSLGDSSSLLSEGPNLVEEPKVDGGVISRAGEASSFTGASRGLSSAASDIAQRGRVTREGGPIMNTEEPRASSDPSSLVNDGPSTAAESNTSQDIGTLAVREEKPPFGHPSRLASDGLSRTPASNSSRDIGTVTDAEEMARLGVPISLLAGGANAAGSLIAIDARSVPGERAGFGRKRLSVPPQRSVPQGTASPARSPAISVSGGKNKWELSSASFKDNDLDSMLAGEEVPGQQDPGPFRSSGANSARETMAKVSTREGVTTVTVGTPNASQQSISIVVNKKVSPVRESFTLEVSVLGLSRGPSRLEGRTPEPPPQPSGSTTSKERRPVGYSSLFTGRPSEASRKGAESKADSSAERLKGLVTVGSQGIGSLLGVPDGETGPGSALGPTRSGSRVRLSPRVSRLIVSPQPTAVTAPSMRVPRSPAQPPALLPARSPWDRAGPRTPVLSAAFSPPPTPPQATTFHTDILQEPSDGPGPGVRRGNYEVGRSLSPAQPGLSGGGQLSAASSTPSTSGSTQSLPQFYTAEQEEEQDEEEDEEAMDVLEATISDSDLMDVSWDDVEYWETFYYVSLVAARELLRRRRRMWAREQK